MGGIFIRAMTCAGLLLFVGCHPENDYTTWMEYKGSAACLQYSALTRIDTGNVTALQIAWQYHTGDADTLRNSEIQCNPIIIDGVLYGTSPKLKLFALDAGTGEEKWTFNPLDVPTLKNQLLVMNTSRGITYWSDGSDDKRIFYTAGSYLHCIHAEKGTPVKQFGEHGYIDLHDHLDREVTGMFVTASSPGVIFKDMIIIGTRVHEGPVAAPGHIRAYDVRTGQLKWIFHTIPHPGEDGHDTWDDPEAYQHIGGANAWSGFSLDRKRAIVFAGTGSASFDFYGGNRTGDNLFANCLLALEANTGKRLWHFQHVHHDVWDRDSPSPPALVTVTKAGKKLDAVALVTKTGYVYLFERTTGKPIYDIIEKPVPIESELTGEKLSPTQPCPLLPQPFVRQLFTEKDINPLLPDSTYEMIKKRLDAYNHQHMFGPPSLQGTVVLPGLDGGAEWGGPSFDPETGILYVNANEMAWVITAIETDKAPRAVRTYGQTGRQLYRFNCMSCHGIDKKGSGDVPSLVDIEKRYSVGAFDSLLQSGLRMMPSFQHLTEEQRKALAAYLLNIESLQAETYPASEDTQANGYVLPYTITGYNKFLTDDGLPALAPPWGTLNAIDLSTGQYIWKKPLGHDPDFPESEIPTGTENYGASVVTAGGLLFIAATKDNMFRAFNKRNGDLLWETELPAAGFATPAVYQHNGRQYIVIACGGGKLRTPSGDSYVAFSLPE